MTSKRPICSSCSSYLSSWGKTAGGRKRFRCKNCKSTRLYHPNKSRPNLFKLFEQYVLWGSTYEMLSAISGYSVPHLIETFHKYLDDPPELLQVDQSKMEEAYLLMDGLWFGRWFVLMVYRQSQNLTILRISTMGREAASRIVKDLKILKESYQFSGFVSDGGTGIVSAIGTVFPNAPHQICLFHMYLDVVKALGKKPKDERVKELRVLADHVWLIESREALNWWKKELRRWIFKHYRYMKERSYDQDGRWWFKHKGVRKAARTLQHLSQVSFTFLDHPTMPKTTNEIEAQFGHLGKRWSAHRGLKRERWIKFLAWFVYLYNQDKLSQSNKKNVVKNNTKS